MRSLEEVEEVRELIACGVNDFRIAQVTGIPRTTVRDWRTRDAAGSASDVRRSDCPVCGRGELDRPAYAYLLGLYLGDGCLSQQPRKKVFKLRITLDARYPGIIADCTRAITAVRRSGHPHRVVRKGCREIASYWNHWPCLFPQHGPGRKHARTIQLSAWQAHVAHDHPDRLLRGLIHSDGCRVANQVHVRGRRYRYHALSVQEYFSRYPRDLLSGMRRFRRALDSKRPHDQCVALQRREVP